MKIVCDLLLPCPGQVSHHPEAQRVLTRYLLFAAESTQVRGLTLFTSVVFLRAALKGFVKRDSCIYSTLIRLCVCCCQRRR